MMRVVKHSTTRHERHPVFDIVMIEQGRSLTWLARETRYSHGHVKNMAAGLQSAGPRFRAACARVLNIPESVLFHDGVSSASPPEEIPEPELQTAALARVP
jgi:hypothetical protein